MLATDVQPECTPSNSIDQMTSACYKEFLFVLSGKMFHEPTYTFPLPEVVSRPFILRKLCDLQEKKDCCCLPGQ
jgi:hypothetical protein